jgi:hypothetical protein
MMSKNPVTILFPLLFAFVAFIPAISFAASVEEFWEDPNDITHDDTDAITPVNTDMSVHIPFRLDNVTQQDEIFADLTSETVLRGLSGLAWGAYNPAIAASVDHDIQFTNNEGLLGANTSRNSRIEFNSFNADSAADFPDPYNEETGAYIYTLFSSNPSVPQTLDLTGGSFKLAVQNKFTLNTPGDINVRVLIQCDGTSWYRSNDLVVPNLDNATDWMNANSNSISRAAREAMMTEFVIGVDITAWERVSAAAEADMNQLDDDGAVALGATVADPGPDLTNVTGMGFVVVELATGATQFATQNDVSLLAIMVKEFVPPPLAAKDWEVFN